jgi:hypothetical protein
MVLTSGASTGITSLSSNTPYGPEGKRDNGGSEDWNIGFPLSIIIVLFPFTNSSQCYASIAMLELAPVAIPLLGFGGFFIAMVKNPLASFAIRE